MANDKDFKVKNGIQPTAYHEAVGTVVSAVENAGPVGVFSTDTYSGGTAQQINNDIDFSTDGGLVWIKRRDTSGYSHQLFDTERTDSGTDTPKRLSSNSTAAEDVYFSSGEWDWLTDGFDLNNTDANLNGSGGDYVAWSFKKESSFFDIVTYTGDGVQGRSISHNLDSVPGVIITKKLNAAENWIVYHVSNGAGKHMYLNTTGITLNSTATYPTAPTSSVFYVGNDSGVNGTSSDTYVSYLFAEDEDNIKCGSYTGTGGSGVSVDLGWQPGWVMIKRATGGTTNWLVWDSERGIVNGGNDKMFLLDTDNAENTTLNRLDVSSTGFEVPSGNNVTVDGSGDTYIYMAIREVTSTNTRTLDLSTGSVFEITPTSDIQVGLSNPAASGTVSAATLLLDQQNYVLSSIEDTSVEGSYKVTSQDVDPMAVAANDDGTIVYVSGTSSDTIYQYTLTKPYDMTTASYSGKSVSTSAQEGFVTGLFFKPDGTSFWVIGRTTDDIYQYDMSTAWDVSTATYASVSHNASGTSNNFYGLTFSNDGLHWFSTDDDANRIVRFTMSTAWDVSTSSLSQSLYQTSIGSGNSPRGVAFDKDDATKLYLSINTDSVNSTFMEVSLPSDYSISSVSSYTFKDVATQSRVGDIFVGEDKSKILWIGGADTVYTFNRQVPYTITYDSTVEFAGGTTPTSPDAGETDVLTFSTRDGGTSYQAARTVDGAR
jgi:hypothetical protein